jgi:hypothetical protein
MKVYMLKRLGREIEKRSLFLSLKDLLVCEVSCCALQ